MREVHVKLLRFEVELNVAKIALPLALGTMSHECLSSLMFRTPSFSATRCSAALAVLARRPDAARFLDSAVHEATVLRFQFQSALSPELGGSAAGVSRLSDSGSQFLSSATQEDFRSSATPTLMLRWVLLSAPLPCGCEGTHFSYAFRAQNVCRAQVCQATCCGNVERALRDKTTCCTMC